MSMIIASILAIVFAAAAAGVLVLVWRKRVHVWLPGYIAGRSRRMRPVTGTRHVLFCFVDHFEPEWRRPGFDAALARVRRWVEDYPRMAQRHCDADGRPPVHTFFFPAEEYRPQYMELLAGLGREGLGEVEVHLHHDNDTSAGLRDKLDGFKSQLRSHGCLGSDDRGNDRFAFIHGNWCLDNSGIDGRWCGVDDEISVLARAGCYADFTLPAAPNPAQTRQVNSIYYAVDDPHKPKSHDTGALARAGARPAGDLMLIQGVLALNWKKRIRGIFPRIENSEICAGNPPTEDRVDLWVREAVGVAGRPEWIFVKVHCHGAGEEEASALLGEQTDAMHDYLERRYNDGVHYRLHYVSAREMYNIARAAEDGQAGDPDLYRDYEIRRPGYARCVGEPDSLPDIGVA